MIQKNAKQPVHIAEQWYNSPNPSMSDLLVASRRCYEKKENCLHCKTAHIHGWHEESFPTASSEIETPKKVYRRKKTFLMDVIALVIGIVNVLYPGERGERRPVGTEKQGKSAGGVALPTVRKEHRDQSSTEQRGETSDAIDRK